MMLPEIADPPHHYRLVMYQATRDWITDNSRMFWRAKARLVKAWRTDAAIMANLHLPQNLPGAHIVCELRFTSNLRRDPNNWNPTAKACIDGFVDAGVFPDDRAEIVEGPDMRIGPVLKRGSPPQIIFHIWPKVPGG